MAALTSIITKLPNKFAAARKSGALFFFDSEVKDVVQDGKSFRISICPALKDKKKATEEAKAAVKANNPESDPDAEQMKGKTSPFEPPYVEDLYVGDVESGLQGEEAMVVLLNKYAVLPEHFLLVTKAPAPQHLPPTPPQLLIAYNLILAAAEHPTSPRRLLGFYNGGTGAGASQSWRHMQFVETPMRRGAPVEGWVKGLEVLDANKPYAHPSLPYLHLIHNLPNSSHATWPPTEASNEKMLSALAMALMRMLDVMFDALRRGGAGRDGGWNLLMTLDHLFLIPRSNRSFPISHPNSPESKTSQLEVNALGYAGMFLVKSEEELRELGEVTGSNLEEGGAALEGTAEETDDGKVNGLVKVLQYCGIPKEWADEPVKVEGPLAGEDGEETAPSNL